MLPARVAVVVLALLAPWLVAAPAPSAQAAGPRLTVHQHRLAAAAHCARKRDPQAKVVLLVHGTGSTPGESFSWGYVRALKADGYRPCTVRLPDRALGDVLVAAQYVVHAARYAYRRAPGPDRRIAIVGHSQGGELAVWATKFWPDVARHTSDVVSIAGPLQGTALADELCAAGRCTVLAWQTRRDSRTIAALNRGRLPRGTSYTSVGTRYDEIVRPQPTVSRMKGVRFVLAQDVCSADPVEHGLILGDPVTYALVRDAIDHPGTAKPRRIPAATCQQAFIPHGDPAGSATFLQTLARFGLGLVDPRRLVDHEPRLPAYAR